MAQARSHAPGQSSTCPGRGGLVVLYAPLQPRLSLGFWTDQHMTRQSELLGRPPLAHVAGPRNDRAMLMRQRNRSNIKHLHRVARVRPQLVRTPKCSARSLVELLAMLLVLLATTSFLGFFGVEDASEALAYTGRFTGALLILGAVATLLSSIAVVDHWFRRSFSYSGFIALLGATTAAMANVMLLVTTLRDGDSTAYLLLWCILVAGSAWTAVTVYRTPLIIPAPKRIAAAVILSGSVAVANFGYTELYQPYQTEANPALDITLGQPILRADRKAFALPITVKFENRSNVGLYMLACEFHVMGRAVALSRTDRPIREWQRDVENGYQLSRREVDQPPQLIEAGSWAVFGTSLAAHQTFSTDRIIELPVNTPYDQIQVRASSAVARRDRLSLDHFGTPQGYSWRGHKDAPALPGVGASDYVTYSGRIHENNAIAEHTRDPRYITIWWIFGNHGSGIAGTISRRGEESRPLSATEEVMLDNRYGFVFVNRGWVTRSLWDIKR